jgi:hypothetical protein
MSKIEWDAPDHPIAGRYTGTDGIGTIVLAKQSQSPTSGFILNIDIILYLEERVEDPRAAIEAAVAALKKELGQ